MIDPAAGSYYIENLTVAIAKQAWELFLAVEEAGGFYAALKAGTVQAAVNESNKARHKAVAQRREVLLGTNQFPNFNEKAGNKQPVEGKCCCGGDSHTCEKRWILWCSIVLPVSLKHCVSKQKHQANVRKRSC